MQKSKTKSNFEITALLNYMNENFPRARTFCPAQFLKLEGVSANLRDGAKMIVENFSKIAKKRAHY